MDAYWSRKGILDQKRREGLKAEIWRLRPRIVELERDRASARLMEVRHAADRASARQSHDECANASRELARLRIRYLNAADLLQKLQTDGPESSARLLGS